MALPIVADFLDVTIIGVIAFDAHPCVIAFGHAEYLGRLAI